MIEVVEVVKERLELCVGCNRCTRSCPMEVANITYQDEKGGIKVKIDHEKCIVCGLCISACKHDARYFGDDTKRFFADLAEDKPISLIAAPAIKTNIPEYKRLFTYLKKLGVNKIYDVSLGADICVWAHIKYLEKNTAPIITQPCPPIVTYCELYRHDLLKRLSPIHSPMACTSIYMKEHEGVTDAIAALSPCMAKTTEFASTKLADYNVTFEHLLEYLKEHGIMLPEEETDFDHAECGLGSLFPVPGGFKENIEYLLGKKLHIAKAEGMGVYDKLNKYAAASEDFLPDIYDVLSCIDGCNIGTASQHDKCMFEIDKAMKLGERRVEERKEEYYKSISKIFDEFLDMSHFMRKYKPVTVPLPRITNADIAKAFKLLGKKDFEQQHVDCYACGSKTCHDMARKIALGVNIPENCIIKSKEDAKVEHVKNMLVNAQLIEMEQTHKMDERVKLLFDSTPFAAHFWDENLIMTDCNAAAAKMFNLTKDEYVKRYFEFMPEYQPDGTRSDEMVRQLIKKTFETGYQQAEFICMTIDKKALPVEDTYVCIDLKGERIVAGYSRDLREHKKMMQKIEASAEQNELQLMKLNVAMKAESIGIWDMEFIGEDTLNPNHTIMWSDEIRYLLGFEDVNDFPNLVSSLINCMEPEQWQVVSDALSAHITDKTGKTPYNMEYRLTKKNGEYAYFHTSGETIRDKEGNPIHVVGALADITESKSLFDETERQRQEAELQLMKLDLAIKDGSIGLWDMDIKEGNPVHPENELTWSDEVRRMLGFDGVDDFPNTNGSIHECLHPDDSEMVRTKLAAHITDKTGKTPFNIEYRLYKKNGELIHVRGNASTIRDEEGNPLNTAGAIFETTEMKNLILEAEKQSEEAQAANRAKSEFLSHISHEIRTPMNAVLGTAEFQLQKDTNTPETEEAFSMIYSSGNLLLSIINDILDLSKIEAGKLTLSLAHYDIPSLINDAMQLNLLRYESKPIEFMLKLNEDTPLDMFGDELRIKQILNNILSNAFKYTDKGEVELSVWSETAISDTDDYVSMIFRISDTGQGMTEEQIGKLFEEYTRFVGDSDRTTVGTGLGMSITKRLVDVMNGDIKVESTPGVGSVFTVRLPQKRIGTSICGREIAESLLKNRFQNTSKLTRTQIVHDYMPYGNVLVVDDVDSNLYVAKGMMLPYGLKIETASSGFEAVDKISEGKQYDIIFMDHMMPKMDGVKTMEKIRELGYREPIVALTANAITGSSDMFLARGFDGYISKPIDLRELNTMLNRLIRDKQTPETLEKVRREAKVAPKKSIDGDLAAAVALDVKNAVTVLESLLYEVTNSGNVDIELFTTTAHGMKSALANIGEKELSAVAYTLEQAGSAGEIEVILFKTPSFINQLRQLLKRLAQRGAGNNNGTAALLQENLNKIKAACGQYKKRDAKTALSELKKKTWAMEINNLLDEIADFLLCGEFEKAAIITEKYLSAEQLEIK
ncbi:MAG: PAS domain-containing protein [Oscillospiraceae bacterium]|nr:PAS domain-containing protein [Oscillospiraceae bacterium]